MQKHLSNRIRLTDFEVDAIKVAFLDNFQDNDHLWIFGSRVNTQQKGGDIDLYIETRVNSQELYGRKINFILNICDKMGEQKIDVVINDVNTKQHLAVYDVAKTTGIRLL